MSKSPSEPSSTKSLEQLKSEAVEQSIAQLQAYLAERNAQRRAQYAEDARIQDKFRDLLFGQLRSNEAALKQLAADQSRLIESRSKIIRRPMLATKKPPMPLSPKNAAAAFFKVPPYDSTWTSNSGQGTESADKNTGVYDLPVPSPGNGPQTVGAGVGFWYSNQGPAGSVGFTAVVNYSFDWWDKAAAYVAHNDGRTWLTVWGMSENGWVLTSGNQTPSWSDGVGWYESHSDNESAQTTCTASFNALANGLYFCWVQSSADAYADSGVFGDAFSSIHINITLSEAVVG
jgi:hypothetical protein